MSFGEDQLSLFDFESINYIVDMPNKDSKFNGIEIFKKEQALQVICRDSSRVESSANSVVNGTGPVVKKQLNNGWSNYTRGSHLGKRTYTQMVSKEFDDEWIQRM